MRIENARRITGRHLLLARPGAAAEVVLDPDDPADALASYLDRVASVLAAVGLPAAVLVRRWEGPAALRGASVAVELPEDALLAGAEALERAAASAGGDTIDAVRWYLRLDPALVDALAWAAARGLPAFHDDDGFTLGMGRFARTWRDAPSVEALAACDARAIPFVYVTGTNGKTTTARWLTRMLRAGGYEAGQTSSDGVVIGDRWIDRGDCTGPGGARLLLRDPAVDAAVVEVARGGLLRRGLVLDAADVAIVTNVGEDHLGEWGIFDAAGMAEVKFVVADALREGGVLVANANCATSVAEVARVVARRPDLRVRWVGRDARVEREWLWLGDAPLVAVADVPMALGGLAAYNLENALAAALAAAALGVSDAAIAAAIREFRPDPRDNPGRTNLFSVGAATVLLDFAHNPEAMAALARFAARWPPGRRTVVVGLAGDRTDALVRTFAREIAPIAPDRVVLKELPKYRRGRPPGEVRAMLREELEASGVAPAAIVDIEDEDDAVRATLSALVAGELLILCVHEDAPAAVQRVLDTPPVGPVS
jgi:cyanophycin synthetase